MAEATQTVVNQVGYNPEVAPYLKENLGQARALTYNYKMGPDGKPIIGANGMPEIESFKAPEKYGGQVPVMQTPTHTEVMEMVVGKRPNPNNYKIADAIALQKNPNDPKYATPKLDAEGKPVTEFKGYERQAEFSDLQKQAMQGARDMVGGTAEVANKSAQDIMKTAADTAAGSTYDPSTFDSQYKAPEKLDYTAKDAAAKQAGIASLPTAQAAKAATMDKAPKGIAAIGKAEQAINAPRMTAATGTAAKDIKGSTVASKDIKAAKDTGLASLKNYQMGAAQEVGSRDVTADTITAAQMGPADKISTDSFAQPGSANAYMSPYMQSVVGIQQREAQRAADVATTGRRGEQTRAGAFGGSRAAIMDAEAARNLATQQGDIQAQGSQEAYKQAQQQFNTEQAQKLQAQQSNQQAGLTVGQQNLTAQQQTNVQNAANTLQAQGMSASQAMQAALANQQAGLTVGKENLSANLGVQQLGEGQINLQTKLANLNNEQQAAVQNESNRLQGQGLTAGQAMQAALANQGVQQQTGMANLANRQEAQRQNQAVDSQYGLANLANRQQASMTNAGYKQQTGMADQALAGQYGMQQGTMDQQAAMQTAANKQAAAMYGAQAQNERSQFNTSNQQQAELANQAARNRASEFGLGQKLTSAGTAAQYGQAANQLNEQSGQFGANYDLQAQQAAMQGATGLSNIAGQGFNQGVQTNQMLSAYGNQQQGAEQQRLNTQYQDFLNEQNDPYKKLGFMANTASAAPTANLGSTMYQAAPSTLSQLGGLGASALGAYGASGGFKSSAGGGMVGRYAKGGLVRSRPQGLVALAIHSMA